MPLVVIHEYDNTIIDLRSRSIATVETGSTVQVLGYHEKGDAVSSLYVYDKDSDEHPNQGTVIAPNSKWTGTAYQDGRWLLQHNGVLTARQFGAIGSTATLFDAVGANLFIEEDEVRYVYFPDRGGPFSGLLYSSTSADCDTMDWAALQAAIAWCADNGVRLEVPSGTYFCRRPVWLGDDAILDDEAYGKDTRQMAFTMLGQTSNTRQQADSGNAKKAGANIRLTHNCANRFVLSVIGDDLPFPFDYKLLVKIGDANALTADISITETADDVMGFLQTTLNGIAADTYVAELDGTDAAASASSENVYFTVRLATDETPEFLGEILVVPTDYDGDPPTYVDFIHCFPDSGVVSFRRSADARMRIENLTLKGNAANEDDAENIRNASFGVLFATTQFFGHDLHRIEIHFADTAVGILQGTGANGEWTSLTRLSGGNCRRGFYSNAPQAFAQEMYGWNFVLDANGVYAEFAHTGTPGVGVNFINCQGTFNQSNLEVMDGTLVRIRRGTGIVQFNGGRVECLSCLFDYDAVDDNGSNCNLDLFVRGMEFTYFKGTELHFVDGWDAVGATLGSNYGLFVEDCKFGGKDGATDDKTDLVFDTYPQDDIRCVFEKCRFVGLRSFSMQNFQADFVRCFKNDFEKSGGTPFVGPLRQFTQDSGLPRARTQSVRTGSLDTPWIQTGPRVNVLKNADLRGQAYSADGETDVTLTAPSWTAYDSTFSMGTLDVGGFGKWGAFAEANISPSPEAFYLALKPETAISSSLDVVDLTAAGMKVATYQALVRVKGKLTFFLAQVAATDHTGNTYDSITVESPKDGGDFVFGDLFLVSLRMQLALQETTYGDLALRIVNYETEDDGAIQVYWQQAWYGRDGDTTFPLAGGLANATHVRTPANVAVQNTYNWAVNALGIKAASRFQLPFLNTNGDSGDAAGMGWKSTVTPADYDLVDGELYYDDWQKAILARLAGDWYAQHQPDRILFDPTSTFTWVAGNQKNIVYTTGATKTFTLDNDLTKIALGTIVRVFNLTTPSATWTSGMVVHSITSGHMSEFMFYNDGGTGRWLITQGNVNSGKMP